LNIEIDRSILIDEIDKSIHPTRITTASGLPRNYSGQEYPGQQQTKPSSSVSRTQPLTAATTKAVVSRAHQPPSAVPRLDSATNVRHCTLPVPAADALAAIVPNSHRHQNSPIERRTPFL
jgi:hypothetical protein